MNILLIGNTETSKTPEEYYGEYTTFFSKAVSYSQDPTSTVVFTLFDDLFITVGDDGFSIFDTRHKLDIKEYDLILVRGKGFRNLFDVVKTISTYAKLNNVPIINDYSDFRDSSKLLQATQFCELNIPVASTVFVNRAVLDEKATLGFGMPCIMKATFGAHGNDNYLINSIEEAREIASKDESKKFVLQKFIPNDNDYRILVIGDEVLVIGREAVSGSHLNNTSQGGSAKLYDLGDIPETVIQDAKKITKHLNMTFSGVDVLADKETGKYYFLEVNSQPQLMSGAFIEEKANIIGRFLDTL